VPLEGTIVALGLQGWKIQQHERMDEMGCMGWRDSSPAIAARVGKAETQAACPKEQNFNIAGI
jgi:hypothetical protein